MHKINSLGWPVFLKNSIKHNAQFQIYMSLCTFCVPTENVLVIVSKKKKLTDTLLRGTSPDETLNSNDSITAPTSTEHCTGSVRSECHQVFEGHHQHWTEGCPHYRTAAGTMQQAFILTTYFTNIFHTNNFYLPSSN